MPTHYKVKKARRKRDWYETPFDLALAAFDAIEKVNGLGKGQLKHVQSFWSVLDAGAGTGVWGRAAISRLWDCHVTGVELGLEPPSRGYDAWRHGDFLTMPFYERYSLVMGNPPFDQAEDFVRRAYDLLVPGGIVLYLLPLSFLGSGSRGRGLWREFPHRHLDVVIDRPSFDGHGTDAMEYGIYLWETNYTGLATQGWTEWRNRSADVCTVATERKAA